MEHTLKCDWPARSPDLMPLDFFIWSFMKERFTEITDRDHLLQRINAAATDFRLQDGLLDLVLSAVGERAQACLRASEGHIEQLLLYISNYWIHVSDSKGGFMCMWHEGINGRGGKEVASTLLKVLNADITHKRDLVLWSNNCPGQKRIE
ncbi:hypothetical protein ANN_24210 [Periplaneta americana]|uniref:Uncharacterized protein n=1 Tax=Periplaneta americana TaxID=6978 RepID=A0ABQ8S2W9_PERAM|nr:hypothetical protein ANN_24210 [Periplaneta americana]